MSSIFQGHGSHSNAHSETLFVTLELASRSDSKIRSFF